MKTVFNQGTRRVTVELLRDVRNCDDCCYRGRIMMVMSNVTGEGGWERLAQGVTGTQ